ncbi:carbohydrate-binding protein [Desulfolucanica intricata]|uniref:carbohydrate-binding protein n=1 Tax=Desulfolucanica intricata TaxID=1285191 RepID=UPI00082F770C|nr:carbohydrate-binding protein [Desulfolucanica intricata]
MKGLQPYIYSEPIRGVQVKPLTEDGKNVNILYNGLLSQAGAEHIVMHAGFGDLNNWQHVNDYNMQRTQQGFEVSVNMKDTQLNFCFKDSFNNWDNNDGQNWIYRIY